MTVDKTCYIRHNLNLMILKVNGQEPTEILFKKEASVVICSILCFLNTQCTAWSYQIATKVCVHFSVANRTFLHPEKILVYIPKTSSNNDGWVSGLGSCHIECSGI